MGVVPRRIWLTVWILLTQEEQEDFSKIIQLWKGEVLDWILPQLHPPWLYCGQDFFMRTLNFSSIDPVDTVKADKSHLRTNVFLPFLHRGHSYIFSMFKDSSYPQILVSKSTQPALKSAESCTNTGATHPEAIRVRATVCTCSPVMASSHPANPLLCKTQEKRWWG